MIRERLDTLLTKLGLVASRSQADSLIKLGKVTVDGKVVTRAGYFVSNQSVIELKSKGQYVSRAGLKLAGVTRFFKLDFRDKTILDVGSSTGGFTDYALQHGAKRVIAVDVGTDQLHLKLREHSEVELHEKTDIRSFHVDGQKPDIILIDVSFISLRRILPYIVKNLSSHDTKIVSMVKPQFEAGKDQVNKGIIKNDSVRRKVLSDFEIWAKSYFVIIAKRDSDITGTKGNKERFYLLRPQTNNNI
jgi:23S rRNA (cytidine1920-2'-O)/16S rRNA (cytidine1409-2'-O)-methyltransferase